MPLEIELPDGSLFNGVDSLESAGGMDDGHGHVGDSVDCDERPGVDVGPVVHGEVPAHAVAASSSFTPTAGQAQAVAAVAELVSKKEAGIHRIVGYAGTGKTTMLKLLATVHGAPAVIAPTGKAALRVSQASGLEAGTAHRWLYDPMTDPKTGKATFTPKALDRLRVPGSRLLLCDEASMIGRTVWADIWKVAQMYRLKVVLIGDGFQLPPVEDSRGAPPFSTMSDAFAKDYGATTTTLTEVLRQAQDSPVVRASMALRAGGMGADALAELPKIDRENLLQACLATRAAGGVIIAHTNVTRHRVNEAMRSGFGGAGPQPGEPLLVLRNDYDLDVFNGEQLDFDGWIVPPGAPVPISCRYQNAEARVHIGVAQVSGKACTLIVEALSDGLKALSGWSVRVGAERWARTNGHFQDGKPLPYLEANYGYCLTAHKSQGSEWPYALVILERGVRLGEEEGRRWAYTAITRAKEMAAVFYGTP